MNLPIASCDKNFFSNCYLFKLLQGYAELLEYDVEGEASDLRIILEGADAWEKEQYQVGDLGASADRHGARSRFVQECEAYVESFV